MQFSRLLSAMLIASSEAAMSTHVYGKYKDASGSDAINSFYLFTPSNLDNQAPQDTKLPVVIDIHGGGFTGGSAVTRENEEVAAMNRNGIAFLSTNYRLVATKYYTEDKKVEELINVDADGKLALDTKKTMDDYVVRRGRQEYNTKCSYDAAQMMEYIIANADSLNIDPHRISFTGGSAGGGEIHYLTWVYHQWNVARYTPRGMVYTMAQLDYPVQNMLDRVWGLWADDVGADTKLSTILDSRDCGMIVGNPWCTTGKSDYNLCNKTYEAQVQVAPLAICLHLRFVCLVPLAVPSACRRLPRWRSLLTSSPRPANGQTRFCGAAAFAKTTLADVRAGCTWPSEDPAVGAGMEVLWYNSVNMVQCRLH